MKKVEKLTAKQQSLIPVYLDKCLKNGLSTQPIDKTKAKDGIYWLYSNILKRPNKPTVLFADSPIQGALMTFLFGQLKKGQLGDQLWDQLWGQLWDQLGGQLGGQLWDQLWDQLRDQLGDQLWDQLGAQLRGQLRDQLGDQLRGQLGDQLRGQLGDQLRGQLGDQLGDQLWAQLGGQLGDQLWAQLGGQLGDQLRDQLRGQLGDQLGDQLWDQLWDQLGAQLGDQLGDQLWAQLGGQLRDQLWDQLRDQLWDQLWAQLGGQLYNFSFISWEFPWVGFYDFILREIFPSFIPKFRDFETFYQISQELGIIIPYENLCVVVERPTEIHRDSKNRLHNDSGLAMAFKDGTGIVSLHGERQKSLMAATLKFLTKGT